MGLRGPPSSGEEECGDPGRPQVFLFLEQSGWGDGEKETQRGGREPCVSLLPRDARPISPCSSPPFFPSSLFILRKVPKNEKALLPLKPGRDSSLFPRAGSPQWSCPVFPPPLRLEAAHSLPSAGRTLGTDGSPQRPLATGNRASCSSHTRRRLCRCRCVERMYSATVGAWWWLPRRDWWACCC